MLALTVSRLWQRGMFLDGLTYAVIARNLADGFGTFWAPAFSQTVYATFVEQPPLGFGLQAAFFAVAGDHVAVERVYALVMFGLSGWLIAAIWRRLLPREFDWLPVLVWMVPSVVTWAVVNNMLEVTQTTFGLLACYALLSAGPNASVIRSGALGALAGASTIAGVLVKGPVGAYPLILPALWFLLPKSERPRRAIVWAAFGGVVALLSVALVVYTPSRTALTGFLTSHVAPVLAGERGAGSRAGGLFRHLAMGVWLRMFVLTAVIWAMARRGRFTPMVRRAAMFLFVVGCASSLPILASPLIAGHYLLPSTPWFALAFGALALPAVQSLGGGSGPTSRRAPLWAASALTAATAGVLVFHGPLEVRNLDLLRDLDSIRTAAPAGQTVGACETATPDYGLLAYFQRFYRISLQADGRPSHGWFLLTPGTCQPPPTCRALGHTETFVLMQCDR